ncbi:replication protein A 70 kDa DNA-binding subunit B [Tanacetum coccineum]|uniref:Replication protein A 70 kDa DNA-binding subunit B n=1 Tax=Tanacetum coccineum TaxID=301880 RepID=A0ABQ5BRN4_9ASTR
MRLHDPTLANLDVEPLRLFTNWLLDMGDGRRPAIALDGEDEATWITIPDELLLPVCDNPIDTIVAYTFPDLVNRLDDINYLKERCILCSTNDVVDGINTHVLEKVHGELHELYSADSDKVLIHRIDMTPTDSSWPFQFRRHQFPVKVFFGMTINKSQGQTFNNVCDFLSKHVFTHGQLYVVASRVTSRSGLCFYIDNGGLCANNLTKNVVYKEVFYNLPRGVYRPLARKVYVQFSRYTRVIPSYIPLEAFPRVLFEFGEYENLKDCYNDDKYLTDVISILTKWGPLMKKFRNNASVNSNVLNVVIRDLSDNRVHVTIWGELASKFDDEIIISKNDHSIVVVFTCCRAKEYKCKPLLTTTSSSHFLLDLELKENDPYRLSPLVPVVFTGMYKNRPVVIHISDLFEKLMAGVELDSTFILDANVIGVDLVNDWKFVQSTECFGKATWNKDHYFYEKKCNRRVINPRQTYKLVLKVGNGCHVMNCVFFNHYARNLLGVSVDDLINKALTLGAGNPYWIEDYFVMNLYGERVVIEIKDDKFNLPPECSRRFSVVKYFGDHPDYIHHRDIIHVAPKLNGADLNDNHVVTNDVDQDIVHDTSHVVAKPNDSHIVVDHIRDTVPLVAEDSFDDVICQQKIQHGEEVPCHKDKSDCIPIKDSINNSAGSLTDLSEVTDDQGGAVVDKSVLNENIYVVSCKNDSIDGVVDKSVIDADNPEAENINIVSEANDKDMDVDEGCSDDIVSEVQLMMKIRCDDVDMI